MELSGTSDKLTHVYWDLWDSTQSLSLSIFGYFITFVNDFSRKNWIYNLEMKDETLEKFKS